MEWRRINVVIGSAIFWFLSQIYWLSLDHVIRDGDEEGHVGAAEIFKDWLFRGEYEQYTTQLLWGDLGEYPPFFAGYIGFWWWLFDAQPEDLLLRSTLLLFPLATACICAWHSKLQKGPWDVIFIITLFLPLTNGLSRHYMIENPLPTCIAFFLLCLSKEERWWDLLAGIVLGIALLCKQTTVLYVLPLLFLYHQRIHWLIFGSILAAPWYLLHFGDQSQYIQQSVSSSASPNFLEIIGAPILSLFWENVGPVGFIIFLGYSLKVWKDKISLNKAIWIAFGCSLLIFILLPKKYPRLMIGMLPLVILLYNDILTKEKTHTQYFIAGLVVVQYLYFSFLPTPPNIFRLVSDDRCPQIWNRPPQSSDLGLKDAYEWIQGKEGISHLTIYAQPIPCGIQTTHSYPYHLEIYLRRRGVEVEVEEVSTPKDAMIIWTEQSQIFRE